MNSETTIPVPAVLSWNATKTSPVGSEYIVMESIPGVPLKDVWNTMSASQHIRCIESIGKLTKQLCQYKFIEYGSLFMKDYAPQGSQSLQTQHSIVLGPTHTWLPDGVLPLESDGPTQSPHDYYAARKFSIRHFTNSTNDPSVPPTAPHCRLRSKEQIIVASKSPARVELNRCSHGPCSAS